MAHFWVATLNLISIAAGVTAALLLYWASLTVPWTLRTWTGQSPLEKRYEKTQKITASEENLTRVGFLQVSQATGQS